MLDKLDLLSVLDLLHEVMHEEECSTKREDCHDSRAVGNELIRHLSQMASSGSCSWDL